MLERYYNSRDIAVLKGKTIVRVVGLEENSKTVIFTCDDGTAYKMYHQQDGGEYVSLAKLDRIEGFYRLTVALLGKCEDEDDVGTAAIELVERKVRDALLDGPIVFAERIVLDRDTICAAGDRQNMHPDFHGMQKTVFLLATNKGVVSLVWTGYSDDPDESTEIDFVQTEGKGVWKAEEHER